MDVYDIQLQIWKCNIITKLRNDIASFIDSNTKSSKRSQKIIKYFTRAFPRWIFNCLSKGMNPFENLLTSDDLLNDDDFVYFFNENPRLSRIELDWTWLNNELLLLYEGPETLDESISLRRVFSKKHVSLTDDVHTSTFTLMQYEYCVKKFYNSRVNGKSNSQVDLILFALLQRYKAIGIDNNHCSAPPNVIKFTMARTELFGTPFNTTLDQFCSPFSDLEHMFGSIGSFFEYEITTGTYFMNPPYDETLMTKSMIKVLDALDTNQEITIIVVIPLWDPKNRKE